MIALVVVFVSIILLSVLDGIRDGIMWSRKGSDALDLNEHLILLASRAVFVLIGFAGYFSFVYIDLIGLLKLLFAGFLCYPFFHNGYMYTVRDVIDPGVYPNRFWTFNSTSSTSKINFNLPIRMLMMFGGLILLYFIIVV